MPDRNPDEPGAVIYIEELRRRLDAMSIDGHQWTVIPVYDKWKEQVVMAEVRYAHDCDLPNELVYRFPVHDIGVEDFPCQLVCVHQALGDKLTDCLYLDGEELRKDFMRDVNRFWEQMCEALRHPARQFYGVTDAPSGQ